MSTVVAPEVAQFVTAVRAELSDLDPEVVEELTGGLEADLTDSMEAVPGNEFGDPVAYAAELRSAAGLPPRPAATPRLGALGPAALAGVLVQRAGASVERVTGDPRWPVVRDFVVTLRPVWWVARAWVGYVAVTDAVLQSESPGLEPRSAAQLVILVGILVASVQLGRRSADGRAVRWRWPVLAANVLALLALPYALQAASVPTVYTEMTQPVAAVPGDGLYLNGFQVTNVRPFDAQGRPLTGVQLFDQDGNPLEVRPNSSNNTAVAPGGLTESLPRLDANGEARWNVFPLDQRATDPLSPPEPVPTAVDPLPDAVAPPSPSASPTAPTAASATPSPPASPSP